MNHYDECTQILAGNVTAALASYSAITGRDPNWNSFNGTFGGKNKTHLSKPIDQYTCFDEYICDYGDHIIGDYLHRVQYGTLSGSSAERMANCLKDPILRNYIMTFLARIFYNATGYAAINHGCGPYSQLTNSMFAAIDNL